jgi:hypothetical protein
MSFTSCETAVVAAVFELDPKNDIVRVHRRKLVVVARWHFLVD